MIDLELPAPGDLKATCKGLLKLERDGLLSDVTAITIKAASTIIFSLPENAYPIMGTLADKWSEFL